MARNTHLVTVIRHDPAQAEAWRSLGNYNREGVWIND